jgi:hypothetical protein
MIPTFAKKRMKLYVVFSRELKQKSTLATGFCFSLLVKKISKMFLKIFAF